MGRLNDNIHLATMFVPNMAEIHAADAADLNSTIITHGSVQTGSEEPDNRSKDFSEVFVQLEKACHIRSLRPSNRIPSTRRRLHRWHSHWQSRLKQCYNAVPCSRSAAIIASARCGK